MQKADTIYTKKTLHNNKHSQSKVTYGNHLRKCNIVSTVLSPAGTLRRHIKKYTCASSIPGSIYVASTVIQIQIFLSYSWDNIQNKQKIPAGDRRELQYIRLYFCYCQTVNQSRSVRIGHGLDPSIDWLGSIFREIMDWIGWDDCGHVF